MRIEEVAVVFGAFDHPGEYFKMVRERRYTTRTQPFAGQGDFLLIVVSQRRFGVASPTLMDARQAAPVVSAVVEIGGVTVLVVGLCAALIHSLGTLVASRRGELAYETLRRDVGKAILLGLEFLVAADIVHSIAVAPTFQSVGVLGLIVLVRTFLSWSLQVEVNGAWPWQAPRSHKPGD